MKKLLVLAVLVFVAFFVVPAMATTYDFNGLNPPGGIDFINSFAPSYGGLVYGSNVVAMDDVKEQSLGLVGIEGHAGLFLPSGFHDFSISFPSNVGKISFWVGSPDGIQTLTANGISFDVGSGPFTKELTLNSSQLHITADHRFTFDNLSTCPPSNPVPLPPTFWLFGSGLLGLAGIRLRKLCK